MLAGRFRGGISFADLRAVVEGGEPPEGLKRADGAAPGATRYRLDVSGMPVMVVPVLGVGLLDEMTGPGVPFAEVSALRPGVDYRLRTDPPTEAKK